MFRNYVTENGNLSRVIQEKGERGWEMYGVGVRERTRELGKAEGRHTHTDTQKSRPGDR
jgi:hypothetical protein